MYIHIIGIHIMSSSRLHSLYILDSHCSFAARLLIATRGVATIATIINVLKALTHVQH